MTNIFDNGFFIFCIVTFINVVLGTVKSILTVRGGKTLASLANAVAQGFNIFVIFLVGSGELDVYWKAGITFMANILGVWIVKWFEEIITPNSEWIYNATLRCDEEEIKYLKQRFDKRNIECVYTEIKKDIMYDIKIFAESKKDSSIIKNELAFYDSSRWYIVEAK